ncbi:beta-ketoacyl-[acyl-carrier-protein] synthase family protein [Methylotetracoccus oryzae]|uniref:beta-ketoacyl-[acyl-carrier-protein] synthase family protein n=1 Tax=Methylotetracoccus oryzae TaxID=1919059 RepID=UPI0011198C3B|nr:beta-ketoacyl-[acyl-carrier-protein] synthase family protein [Methylotetracoccus oryzae]
MTPLRVSAYSLVSAIGSRAETTLAALRSRQGGLRPCDFPEIELDTWIGRVPDIEDRPLPAPLSAYDCRNNRLAAMALEGDDFSEHVAAAAALYGRDRIAVIVGTSTSGILESESAYRRRDAASGALPPDFRYRTVHNTFSVADFTRRCLGLGGPATAISTACSSSAKAFASASRLMDAGFCDAAVVGGVDSLCGTTLHGFHALQLTSARPCRPADTRRDGISIGEAAGFVLLEKASDAGQSVQLIGYGESADAYHMSSPHPEGAGARLAMQDALQRAGVCPEAVDHVLLHGTGTLANDAAEDCAIASLLGERVGCSSIKGWTGHTLGAAGVVNAIIAALSLDAGLLPGTLQTQEVDPRLRCRILLDNRESAVRYMLCNSFGFGGSNATLLFRR